MCFWAARREPGAGFFWVGVCLLAVVPLGIGLALAHVHGVVLRYWAVLPIVAMQPMLLIVILMRRRIRLEAEVARRAAAEQTLTEAERIARTAGGAAHRRPGRHHSGPGELQPQRVARSARAARRHRRRGDAGRASHAAPRHGGGPAHAVGDRHASHALDRTRRCAAAAGARARRTAAPAAGRARSHHARRDRATAPDRARRAVPADRHHALHHGASRPRTAARDPDEPDRQRGQVHARTCRAEHRGRRAAAGGPGRGVGARQRRRLRADSKPSGCSSRSVACTAALSKAVASA